MLTTAIALLITIQAPQQDSNGVGNLSAAQIMSKVFAHYSIAQSVSGTVTMTQTAKGVSVVTQTEMQYDRPSKFYLHQVRNGSQGHEWLVTSDGKEFSYGKPQNEFTLGAARYVEFVTQHDITQTVPDIYTACRKSIGDPNPILDVAIYVPAKLQKLKEQWVSLAYRRRETVNGQSVQVLGGQWREQANSQVTGEFEIYVTEAGDFVRYATLQRFLFPKASPDPIDVTTTWDSTLKIGVKTNPTLYRVVN